ncbi:Nuclear transport factor 2 (NTF2) family protein with RNA binding (RRM-RBD-RNP motifs) domain [Striga hermonthica]|uniref:Nuclear transport factor 2 (NTF2) family protein with RNA binding (RRM-RBD-RNP motifs) domain n=1 Tax=Striga hermonthica TaxID=68872 RepID=A0A9N7RRD9_STRHE|nr:Nuclear transport factor 2 (NTF2) family protein with RNA binding (RRM-RBD-RNP motifs) domain [Striga hermonthica]
MATTEAAAQQPVSAQVVGNAFVQQYYHILHHSPRLVHRFYQDISKLGRPEEDGTVSITTTMQAINEKIVSLNYDDFRAEIKSVDAQESYNGGVHVFVIGSLTGKDNAVRQFAQAFFLAPQDRGYFVLNDMFRYVDSLRVNLALVSDVVPPVTDEQVADTVDESHVSEQSTPSTEEAITGEVYNPPDALVEQEVVDEEVPVAEVVDEVQDDVHVVESSAKIDELPKKSYASIVKHLKESGAIISPPLPAPRKAPPKHVEQANRTLVPATDGAVPSYEVVDNGNYQDGEADGHSIYIKGLPMNATVSMLEEVFKKFGAIKNEGIQVRSNKQQGFCFGFVEFEEASSVQKALDASPVAIGGRQAFVEEKRSTNSRGNIRGRLQQSGRGSGFRNEGFQGRSGIYGGGRGTYNKGGFRNQRGEENMNGRVSRTGTGGVVANGSAKNTSPRVSATA